MEEEEFSIYVSGEDGTQTLVIIWKENEMLKTDIRYQEINGTFKQKEFNTVKLNMIEFKDGNVRFDLQLSLNNQIIYEEHFSNTQEALKKFYKFANRVELFENHSVLVA